MMATNVVSMHGVVLSALVHEAHSRDCEGVLLGVSRPRRHRELLDDGQDDEEKVDTIIFSYAVGTLMTPPNVVGWWSARHKVPPTPSLKQAANFRGRTGVLLCVSIDGPDARYSCLEQRGRSFGRIPLKIRTLAFDSTKEHAAFSAENHVSILRFISLVGSSVSCVLQVVIILVETKKF